VITYPNDARDCLVSLSGLTTVAWVYNATWNETDRKQFREKSRRPSPLSPHTARPVSTFLRVSQLSSNTADWLEYDTRIHAVRLHAPDGLTGLWKAAVDVAVFLQRVVDIVQLSGMLYYELP